ncbi:MAG: hypothetical protein ACOYL5_00375 [Phototrophicaceae bacterium]
MKLLRNFTLVLSEIILLALFTVVAFISEDRLQPVITFVAGQDILVRIVVVVIVDLLLIVAIFAQLFGGTRVRGAGLLVKNGQSATMIDTESVHESVLRAIRQLENVESCEGETKAIGGQADIQLQVVIDTDKMNIPNKEREISRTINQVVVKQMGVELRRAPLVKIKMRGDDEVLAERTTIADAQRAAQEATSQMAAEKAAKENAQRLMQEVEAKAASEKAAREAAEKTAREAALQMAAEKTAREAAEKAAQVAAEQAAAEHAAREAAEKAAQSLEAQMTAEQTARAEAEKATQVVADEAAHEVAEVALAEQAASAQDAESSMSVDAPETSISPDSAEPTTRNTNE